ncbi:MAG TPA: nitroreductase family protein [Spirochaetota bacterium]|nr:nitroreductase family protein [Spirochaetota bacterium]
MQHNSQVMRCLFNRRSIRKFKAKPVAQDKLELLIKAFEAAPSAGNIQPWFLYLVNNQAKKEKLCQLSFDQEAVKNAPTVITVCADPALSAAEYGDAGRDFFCIQDTAAAVQNLLLAVHDLGLGAVWIGVLKEKEIAACLDLPARHKPVALIPVGIPAEKPAAWDRKGWQHIYQVIN